MAAQVAADEQSKKSMIAAGFPRSSMKREMMCRRLDILREAVKVADVDSIQMILGDFLMEARSLHDVIKNEGDSHPGFREWWVAKQQQLEADPLMNWAHKARAGDFHHGVPSIEITGWQLKGGFEYDPEQRSDAKNLMMHDGGMFWISYMGTPDERIERARLIGANLTFVMQIAELTIEEGSPKSIDDIPKLCEEIARKNQELLHEVKIAFGPTAPREVAS